MIFLGRIENILFFRSIFLNFRLIFSMVFFLPVDVEVATSSGFCACGKVFGNGLTDTEININLNKRKKLINVMEMIINFTYFAYLLVIEFDSV